MISNKNRYLLSITNRYSNLNMRNRIIKSRMVNINRNSIPQIQQNRERAVQMQNINIVKNYLNNLYRMLNPSNRYNIQSIHHQQLIINKIRHIQNIQNLQKNQYLSKLPTVLRRLPQIPTRSTIQTIPIKNLVGISQRNFNINPPPMIMNIKQYIQSMQNIQNIQNQQSNNQEQRNNVNEISIQTTNPYIEQIRKQQDIKNKQTHNSSACLFLYHSRDLLTTWIIHNKKLGFDHLYIIDSNYSKDTYEYLSIEINKGYITYEDSRQQHGISVTPDTVPNIFFQKYHNETKWMIVLEIDEYIVLKEHFSINTLINEYNNFSSISIIRYLFGSNNYIEHRDNIFESYTKRVDDNILTGQFYYKPLIQTDHITQLNKNDAGYKSGRYSVDETKNFVTGEKPKRIRTDIIQINAYVLRSYDDYMEKIKSIPQVWVKNQENTMYYFNTLNRICYIEDKSIVEHHYPVIKKNKPLNTDDIENEHNEYNNEHNEYNNEYNESSRIYNNLENQGNIYVVYNDLTIVNNVEEVKELEEAEEINDRENSIQESSIQIEEINNESNEKINDEESILLEENKEYININEEQIENKETIAPIESVIIEDNKVSIVETGNKKRTKKKNKKSKK